MSTKQGFIIKNKAQLQVFLGLFSAALVGATTALITKDSTKGIVRKADEIASEAAFIFETHLPLDEGTKEQAGDPSIRFIHEGVSDE